MQSQYQCFSNQLMFTQHGKTREDEGKTKEEKQNPQINLEHITCNDCGGNTTLQEKMNAPHKRK